MSRPPKTYKYSDNSYAGNGVLKCTICKQPYRDHDVRYPCPELVGRLTTDRGRRSDLSYRGEAERKHYAAEKKAADRLRTRILGPRPPE